MVSIEAAGIRRRIPASKRLGSAPIIAAALALIAALFICGCVSISATGGSAGPGADITIAEDEYVETGTGPMTAEEMQAYTWPKSGPCKLIPQLQGTSSFLQANNDEEFVIWVGGVDAAAFAAYAQKCREAGFNLEEQYIEENVFMAKDAAGDVVTLLYEEDMTGVIVEPALPADESGEGE